MYDLILCINPLCQTLSNALEKSQNSNRDELQIKTVIDHDLKELDEWSKKWLMSFKGPTI
jgi:hypothetical protein